MRMDSRRKLTAEMVVNRTPSDDLALLLKQYGEERNAKRIAREIERRRAGRPVRTTIELADIVAGVVRTSPRARIHPATRTFQALRMVVNDELANLERGLKAAVGSLNPGGRLCVVSFHSLEDRMVKRTFNDYARACECPPELPVCACGKKPILRILTKKPAVPSPNEVRRNPRSRSAKLRVAERTEESF